jgi:hypothetical protein
MRVVMMMMDAGSDVSVDFGQGCRGLGSRGTSAIRLALLILVVVVVAVVVVVTRWSEHKSDVHVLVPCTHIVVDANALLT